MKTTCLIPVPVKKIKSIEFKLLNEENGAIGSDADGQLHLINAKSDIKDLGIKDLFTIKSGYFFTEEEMERVKELYETLEVISNEEQIGVVYKLIELLTTK